MSVPLFGGGGGGFTRVQKFGELQPISWTMRSPRENCSTPTPMGEASVRPPLLVSLVMVGAHFQMHSFESSLSGNDTNAAINPAMLPS